MHTQKKTCYFKCIDLLVDIGDVADSNLWEMQLL